jgi:hypothetical protein
MKAFGRLLWKDLELSRLPMLINGVAAILWQLFLRTRLQQGWPAEAVAALLFLPMAFLPLWFVWQTYQSLRTEWREDTIYTLLALPVPGWKITLSKLTALLIEYTVVVGIWALGGLVIYWSPLSTLVAELFQGITLSWFIRNGFLLYLMSLGVFASFIIYMQVAYITAKVVGRFHGLVLLWVLLLQGWVVDTVGTVLQPVFAWLPSIPLHRLFNLDQVPQAFMDSSQVLWDLSGSIGSWLAFAGLFFLGAWLLENFVEVN